MFTIQVYSFLVHLLINYNNFKILVFTLNFIPSSDRSPLVVLNGENGLKRKQLTLKDMVSPKPKQSTLSNFKVLSQSSKSASTVKKLSPKDKASKQPVNKSPKEVVSPVPTISTTPVRGMKRKSNFSGEEEENQATKGKQAKIPEEEKVRVDESPKSRNVPKPTLASMLIRSPKQQNSKKKDVKVDNEKEKEKEKDSEKVELKASSEAEQTLIVKPVKKRFGDYKRKEDKNSKSDKLKVTAQSDSKDVTPAVSDQPSKKVEKIRSKTAKPVAKVVPEKIASPPGEATSEVETKENVEPSDAAEIKTSEVQVDGEEPGPSEIIKPAVKKVFIIL